MRIFLWGGKRNKNAKEKDMTELIKLKDTDLDKAYGIIRWRFDYLINKGIKQYCIPYPPFDIYKERQENGFNYGLYTSGNLIGIVSLVNLFPEEWKEIKIDGSFHWISSFFTSKEARGLNISTIIMEKIEEYSKSFSVDNLILDCFINEFEFLVKFYQRFGFKEIKRKEISYPNHSFIAAFMLKKLTSEARSL